MSKAIDLPDHLYHVLASHAQRYGVTPENLLARLVEEHFLPLLREDISLDDIRRATRALLYGEKPPWPVDWDELDRIQDKTDPYFTTLEEAMSWARGYTWVVDR